MQTHSSIPPKTCECGCGRKTQAGARWFHGHAPQPNGPPPLCECGCGTQVAWYPHQHRWHRYLRGHNDSPLWAEKQFWAKVEKTDTCWLWRGCHDHIRPDAYGYVRYCHEKYRAHRLAWMLANGPIPDGLFVCHRCDTPLCVNPDHLFLGTAQDNSDDKCQKGRERYDVGSAHPRAKLTEADVLEIRRLRDQGLATIAELSERYAVAHPTISSVATRRSWRHLP